MRAGAALLAAVALALGRGAAATQHQRAPFPTQDASGAFHERRALVAFANATNWRVWRQPWPLQRWRDKDPCRDGWTGVFCAPNGRVRRLCGQRGPHPAPVGSLVGEGPIVASLTPPALRFPATSPRRASAGRCTPPSAS